MIARRVVVEPEPGWRKPVNLFVAVLLEPGNRKSAVFADATRPLRELEAELIEAARPTVARQQCERRQSEARLKKLERQAAEKEDTDAGRKAGDLAADLAELPESVLPRLIVDDATSEKLNMLAEQGGHIASMSPEGGVFDVMAGLYSKSGIPQFAVYLKGHSGDDLITDRVSRKSVRGRAASANVRLRNATGGYQGVGQECGLPGPGPAGTFPVCGPAKLDRPARNCPRACFRPHEGSISPNRAGAGPPGRRARLTACRRCFGSAAGLAS